MPIGSHGWHGSYRRVTWKYAAAANWSWPARAQFVSATEYKMRFAMPLPKSGQIVAGRGVASLIQNGLRSLLAFLRPRVKRKGSDGLARLQQIEELLGHGSWLPRLSVVVVLLISSFLDQDAHHGTSHWVMLAIYGLTGIVIAALSRARRRSSWVPWAGTILDAAIAVYVIVEHFPRDAHDAYHASDALSLLPAFLFLLQTGLSLRKSLVLLFAGLVTAGWSLSLTLLAIVPGGLTSAEGVAIFASRQVQGLSAFFAVTLFVLGTVLWMRRATAAAWREREDRLLIFRFLPDGVAIDVVGRGDAAGTTERHACILSIDIRGFSALTRNCPPKRTVFWLLAFRRIVHKAVSLHGGVIDKYLGDGVLALFLDGEPNDQARNALAAARSITEQFRAINMERRKRGDPLLETIVALHCGDVLAGVFDDGHRAEFTVLGPAMNAVSRIERRGKEADAAIVASLAFFEALTPFERRGLDSKRLPIDEPGLSELVVL
jgi:adenylate cyclase